jgi:hypothetical protein
VQKASSSREMIVNIRKAPGVMLGAFFVLGCLSDAMCEGARLTMEMNSG